LIEEPREDRDRHRFWLRRRDRNRSLQPPKFRTRRLVCLCGARSGTALSRQTARNAFSANGGCRMPISACSTIITASRTRAASASGCFAMRPPMRADAGGCMVWGRNVGGQISSRFCPIDWWKPILRRTPEEGRLFPRPAISSTLSAHLAGHDRQVPLDKWAQLDLHVVDGEPSVATLSFGLEFAVHVSLTLWARRPQGSLVATGKK
jgi:hypothetical protein